jgi:DNA-directed RNA polymerase III subunit RPC2
MQVMVNKVVPTQCESVNPISEQNKYHSAEIQYKGLDPAFIEKVMISVNSDNNFLVKLLTRQTRIPEIGDKFSSRHGQKGVVGTIKVLIFLYYI